MLHDLHCHEERNGVPLVRSQGQVAMTPSITPRNPASSAYAPATSRVVAPPLAFDPTLPTAKARRLASPGPDAVLARIETDRS